MPDKSKANQGKETKKGLDSHATGQLQKREIARRRQNEAEQVRKEEEGQEKLESEVVRLAEENAKLVAQLEERDGDVEQLTAAIAQLRELFDEHQREAERGKVKCVEMEAKVEEAQQREGFARTESEDLQQQISALQEKIRGKDEELENLSAEVARHVQKAFYESREKRGGVITNETKACASLIRLEDRIRTFLATGEYPPAEEREDDFEPPKALAPSIGPCSDGARADLEGTMALVREARASVQTLQDMINLESLGHTLHSQLGTEARAFIADLSRDQLLVLLDCLSFEQGVVDYISLELPKAQPFLPNEEEVLTTAPQEGKVEEPAST